MRICGVQKTTLLDYPGHVAATVFTGGCNFRCPFCHNAGLVLGFEEQGYGEKTQGMISSQGHMEKESVSKHREHMKVDEVLAYLQKRKGILEGVCITGGEPTLQSDLEDFIRKVKELGYLVKLDTNGYRPGVLKELLESGLLDYVAMDIKASRENYGNVAGVTGFDIASIEESVKLLKGSDIPYEFRTTVVKGIHTLEEFETIGEWLAGCRAYYLQGFQENENLLYNISVEKNKQIEDYRAYSKEEMEQMAELARKYIDKVVLRGVE